jgi:hypothetical protein
MRSCVLRPGTSGCDRRSVDPLVALWQRIACMSIRVHAPGSRRAVSHGQELSAQPAGGRRERHDLVGLRSRPECGTLAWRPVGSQDMVQREDTSLSSQDPRTSGLWVYHQRENIPGQGFTDVLYIDTEVGWFTLSAREQLVVKVIWRLIACANRASLSPTSPRRECRCVGAPRSLPRVVKPCIDWNTVVLQVRRADLRRVCAGLVAAHVQHHGGHQRQGARVPRPARYANTLVAQPQGFGAVDMMR